jgi:hypothetical protein
LIDAVFGSYRIVKHDRFSKKASAKLTASISSSNPCSPTAKPTHRKTTKRLLQFLSSAPSESNKTLGVVSIFDISESSEYLTYYRDYSMNGLLTATDEKTCLAL